MKIKLSLLALALALVYAIVIQFLPDFPLSEETVLALLIYVLSKLGVEVVEARVAAFLARFK